MKQNSLLILPLLLLLFASGPSATAFIAPPREVPLSMEQCLEKTSSVVIGSLEGAWSEYIEIPEGYISGNTGSPRNLQQGMFQISKVLFGTQNHAAERLTFKSEYLVWNGPFKKGAISILILDELNHQLRVLPLTHFYGDLACAKNKNELKHCLVGILQKELQVNNGKTKSYSQNIVNSKCDWDRYLNTWRRIDARRKQVEMLADLSEIMTPVEAIGLTPLLCDKEFSAKDEAQSTFVHTYKKFARNFFADTTKTKETGIK